MVGDRKGRGDAFAGCAELVAVGFLNFDDQAVGLEQGEFARDGGCLATLLLVIRGGPVEGGAEVAITKAVEQEIALGQAAEQFAIGAGGGIQGPSTAAVFILDRLTQGFQQLAQRSGFRHGGQAVSEPVVGGVADFGTSAQIRDALAEVLPGFESIGVLAFLGAKNLKALGAVDGGFDAEGLPFLVLDFEGVGVVPEFQAGALGAGAEIDFGFVAAIAVTVFGDLFAEVTQDIFAAERGDAVLDPARIPQGQIAG